MLLKPFEAGRYDDDSIVVTNPVNGKQELFSDREYAIVKFLKQNEAQSLLALLMPNIGIAKKTHIEMCLRVLTKLKRIQIADYFSITGRKPVSDTATTDITAEKTALDFANLHPLAAAIFAISGKSLVKLGQAGILGLVVLFAAMSFALFPFEAVEPALKNSTPSYLFLFLLAYLVGCLAFGLRSILQGAFLQTLGREVANPGFKINFPFFSLHGDMRAVNLLGFKARVQMAVIGLISPFALACVFTLLTMATALSAPTGFVAFSACAGVALALACPLLSFDGADLLQALLFREEIEQTISTRLRNVLKTRGALGREMVFCIFLSVGWFAVWLDCLHSFRETFSSRFAEDLVSASFSAKSGALLGILLLVALLCLPIVVMGIHYFRESLKKSKKRMVVAKDKVKDSLTFEERIAALERIPLFAYLNDQERLALLNEMQPAFFKHGDFLVHQGELGKEFFVLVKGHAIAQFTDPSGKAMILSELVEGDAFGEIALIDDVPRTASIISEGGCIALVLRKEGFDRFSESLGSPDRVKAMIRLTSFFRRHPLFSKLTPRDQAQLIDSFRFKTVTSGEQISDGDESFHVIYSGSVRVDTGGADGETSLSCDDCFGYSNPLNARYVATEGTGLLSVAKDQFHNLIWEKLVEKPELFV